MTQPTLKIALSKEFFSRPHGWADSDGKAEVTATFIAEGYNYAPNSDKGNCADFAALIVKAVNAYGPMVEALENALTWNDADIKGYEEITPNLDMLKERRKVIKAALKLAKGE